MVFYNIFAHYLCKYSTTEYWNFLYTIHQNGNAVMDLQFNIPVQYISLQK
jgi:hypothetical protein